MLGNHSGRSAWVAGLACLAIVAAGAAASAAERPLRVDSQGNPIPSSATSFDCSKARGFAETTICTDVGLALADRDIDGSYLWLLAHTPAERREALRRDQRAWLESRDACAKRSCLETFLDARSAALAAKRDGVDRALRVNVSRIGQCEVTQIEDIGPRLDQVEGEPPDGTTVEYADGVVGVSYDREPEILRSRVGDPVRVCFVSRPRHCPPGDDRGKVYAAFNLRTHGRWKLSDAEHMCGGA